MTRRAGAVPAVVEIPVDGERTLGVLHRPATGPVTTSVLVAPRRVNAGSAQWDDVRRDIARELAALGIATLRFDWLGTGSSTGGGTAFERSTPRTAEVAAAVATLREMTGSERVLGVASCYGATMFVAAASAGVGFDGLMLTTLQVVSAREGEGLARASAERLSTSGYVAKALRLQTLRRLRDRAYRRRYAQLVRAKASRLAGSVRPGTRNVPYGISGDVVAQLRTLADAAVPVTLLYGEDDPEYGRFTELTPGPLSSFVSSPGVDVRTIPGVLHQLVTARQQRLFGDAVVEWATAGHREGAGATPGT